MTVRFGAPSSGWSPGSGSGSVTSSAGARDPALAQGALERGGVDDRPARRVDEIGGVAHRAQLRLADQMAGLLRSAGSAG